MALHNNLRLFFLFHSLLIPLHLSQPETSPSPNPNSSLQYETVSSPSLAPASAPTPFTSTTPSISLPPESSDPTLGPAQGTSPSSGPAPGPLEYSGPALGPSPSSGPAPGPLEYLGPTPGPAPSTLDTPTESDGEFNFDFPITLPPSVDVDPDVKKICDTTEHPAICLATVVPFLDGKTDVPSVLEVAIRAGAKVSKYGLSLAKKLVGEPGISNELAVILDDCKSCYSDAVEDYEIAIDAFPEHDLSTIMTKLSGVITHVVDCEDALSEAGQDSPFSSIAPRLRQMTSNCLAISALLK